MCEFLHVELALREVWHAVLRRASVDRDCLPVDEDKIRLIVEELRRQLALEDTLRAASLASRNIRRFALVAGPERMSDLRLLLRVSKDLRGIGGGDNFEQFVLLADCCVVGVVSANELLQVFIFEVLLRLFGFLKSFFAARFSTSSLCQLVCLEQPLCLLIVHTLLLPEIEGQECLLKLLLRFLVLLVIRPRFAVQSARVVQVEEGVLACLLICGDHILFENAFFLRLCSVNLSLSLFDVLISVILRIFRGHQRLVSLFVHLVVIFIRCKRDVRVLVVNYAAIRSERVGPGDALLRDASEHVQHPMEFLQVIEISVNLADKAEWSAAELTATRVGDARWANPGRPATNLGRRE